MKTNYLFFPLVLAGALSSVGCTVSATPPPQTVVAYVDPRLPPPPPPAHYVRGHWEHRGRTTVWIDGHWV
jgi:hypothetical protein